LLTSPLIALYGLRLVANDVPKMRLFARQFSGMPVSEFRAMADDFARMRIPLLIRPEALDRLRVHKSSGHTVVIVSASIEEWITPWANSEGVEEVIASRAETRGGRLTGKLEGANCHGEEKVRRLMARFPDRGEYGLYAYGDSRGDVPMLDAADFAFYRRFA